MPTDLSRTLVVAVSSTALFDLTAENDVFLAAVERDHEGAIQTYRAEMHARETEPLAPGPAMPLVRALLGLNRFQPPGEPPLVEVVVMSRNSPETGLRVLNAIRVATLPITRSGFTGGEPVAPLLRAYQTDLFLTTSPDDAQRAIDERSCAAATLSGTALLARPDDGRVHIAFDGDAVLFHGDSEFRYKTEGMSAFHEYEDTHESEPLADGPFADLLRKLSRLQSRLPVTVELSPVRISLVTARTAPSVVRAIKTLRHWNVYVDEAYFLGGLDKAPVVEAIGAHIFFDDQELYLRTTRAVVPSGKVPYPEGSKLGTYTTSEAARLAKVPATGEAS